MHLYSTSQAPIRKNKKKEILCLLSLEAKRSSNSFSSLIVSPPEDIPCLRCSTCGANTYNNVTQHQNINLTLKYDFFLKFKGQKNLFHAEIYVKKKIGLFLVGIKVSGQNGPRRQQARSSRHWHQSWHRLSAN